MFEYENISQLTPQAAMLAAKEALATGWTRRGYPSIKLQRNEIPWEFRSHQERSWNFSIHSWDMLEAILKAHTGSNNPTFLNAALEVALDWFNYLDKTEEVSPFAWYDMAVGLRAYRLAYLFEAAETACLLSEVDHRTLWRGLELHQDFLSNDKNIVFHNNHGFYQAAGQLAMGRRFATRSSMMVQARSQGRERFLTMLDTQFATDGVHLEHSPDYHRMVYATLRGVLDAGLISDPDILAFADRIEEALSWFVQPNQRLANFGDSDYQNVGMSPGEAEECWRSDAMRFAVSGGACGAPPKESVAAFEEGGYFVVKTPAEGGRGDPRRWVYLAQQAAFHSRTHKHADTLSLIWHEHGHDILVDSGRYGYIRKAEQGSELWKGGHWYSDPKRIYCESTRAHNTVEFDQENYPRKGIKPPGSLIGRHTYDQSGVYMLETEARHMRGLRHARVLFYRPGQWLIVFDWYKNNLGAKHIARQWFHFFPELKVENEVSGYSIRIPGQQVSLKVQPCLPVYSKLPITRGQEEPVMQGWWSGKERELIPADSAGFEQTNSSEGQFATIFSFSNNIECDFKETVVASSGRHGIFAWRDDNGAHRVSFRRGQRKSDFFMNYTDQASSSGIKQIVRRLFLRKIF